MPEENEVGSILFHSILEDGRRPKDDLVDTDVTHDETSMHYVRLKKSRKGDG